MNLIILALLILACIWLWPRFWLALVRDKIIVEVEFSPVYVYVGDTVDVLCVLRNESWLPCPFVELSIGLPEGLSTDKHGKDHTLRYRTYLQPHQELEFHGTCHATKRGFQRLSHHPVVVTMNEGLGLTVLAISKAQKSHMTVMPAQLPTEIKKPQFQEISGGIERFHWLQPDETLIRGLREYRMGDPFRYIAWQASATAGQWMVKEFSASTESAVCLFLNAQMFHEYWSGTRHEEFDRLCEIVEAYAWELEEKGFRLQFVTNAILYSDPVKFYFPHQTAGSVSALLGELGPYATRNFGNVWGDYRAQAPSGEIVVVFTSYWEPDWERLIESERQQGKVVELVFGPNLLRDAAEMHDTSDFVRGEVQS